MCLISFLLLQIDEAEDQRQEGEANAESGWWGQEGTDDGASEWWGEEGEDNGGWWDGRQPKRKRSKAAWERRKEHRKARAWLNERAERSPEKLELRAARQQQQLQQKAAARERKQARMTKLSSSAGCPIESGTCTQPSETATATLTGDATPLATSELGPFFCVGAGSDTDESVPALAGDLASALPAQSVPVGMRAPPPTHTPPFTLAEVHCDAHVDMVFKNSIAFPPGTGSFVDSFCSKSEDNYVRKVPRNTCVHAMNPEGQEIYAMEGEGAQTCGLDGPRNTGLC